MGTDNQEGVGIFASSVYQYLPFLLSNGKSEKKERGRGSVLTFCSSGPSKDYEDQMPHRIQLLGKFYLVIYSFACY